MKSKLLSSAYDWASCENTPIKYLLDSCFQAITNTKANIEILNGHTKYISWPQHVYGYDYCGPQIRINPKLHKTNEKGLNDSTVKKKILPIETVVRTRQVKCFFRPGSLRLSCWRGQPCYPTGQSQCWGLLVSAAPLPSS